MMRRLPLLLAPLVLVGLLAAGCGGGGSKSGSGGTSKLPTGVVASIGDRQITKAQFNVVLAQAQKSYKLQKRAFPKAGTADYQALVQQIMQFLVQRVQFELKAKELGITITPKQIDDKLVSIKKQYFGGDEKKYQDQLKKQGLSEQQVRDDIRSQLVSDALFKKVTAAVKVTDKDISDYYKQNQALYTTKESRDVRHILVKEKKLADDLYGQLKAGGDFAALAKKFSIDPGSKNNGGKLTIARGDTVPEFDKAAFDLKTNEISKPIKTQYGWHIIQPVSDIKPAKVTPLAKVKTAISSQLLQQRKSSEMQKWVDGVKAEFAKKTKYAVGYAPPVTTSATTGTTSTNQ